MNTSVSAEAASPSHWLAYPLGLARRSPTFVVGLCIVLFFLVLAVLFMHALITYPIMLRLLAGLNPYRFFMKIRPANTRGYIPRSWKDEDNYQSYRSFSCMSYQDSNYKNWGPVITINDDRTKP